MCIARYIHTINTFLHFITCIKYTKGPCINNASTVGGRGNQNLPFFANHNANFPFRMLSKGEGSKNSSNIIYG